MSNWQVMSWWPFKSMILRGRSPEAESAALKPKYLFHFGDAAPFIQSLGLSNRLTGSACLYPPIHNLIENI